MKCDRVKYRDTAGGNYNENTYVKNILPSIISQCRAFMLASSSVIQLYVVARVKKFF